MTDILCGYPDRDQLLVTYLYDDLDDVARSAFDTHLALCAPCRAELAQLRGVRRQLGQWEAPSVISRQSSVVSHQSSVPGRGSWWRDMPVWAQVAAAVLCLGVGAGLANLDMRYDQHGLSVRTGWLTTDASPTPPPAGAGSTSAAAVTETAAPWRADLAALERQLRTEFRSTETAASDPITVARASQPSMSEAALMRRVRALVEESERRQERELALRVGQVIRDVNAQRQSDLRKIDSNLGFIQSNTGAEVMKQRQLLMNYLVRVSSQK